MKVLVLTVVHHPEDARIARRQIGAMLDAGWTVRFAAPWRATGASPPPGVEPIDVVRAVGRHRLPAAIHAWRLLRSSASDADVILIHDPELLVPLAFARVRTPVIWDVHEDTVGALSDRSWLPRPLRSAVGRAVRLLERYAERRAHLLLAESAYQRRFRDQHPIIRNVPPVSAEPPKRIVDDRVVQLGRVSRLRGAFEMVELGKRLRSLDIRLELIGPVDAEVRGAIEEAASRGDLIVHGFVPNAQALELLDGAIAGVSLLHDVPNYQVSLPTKVVEYLARGIPAITTPLPAARDLVEHHDVGVVVPFGGVDAVVASVQRWQSDPSERLAIGRRAHRVAFDHYNWDRESSSFLDSLAEAAAQGRF